MTVNRITIKQVIKSPLFLCIVMQPILDIIAYIQYNNPIGTMAGYLRLAFVIVVPIFVFIKTSYKKGFLFSLLPIALLGLLHCANSFRVGYISFFEDMGYFIRTWYMPILAISFIFYFNHRKEKDYELMSKEIQYGFLVNLLLIFLVVILAWITGTGRYTYVDYDLGLTGWFAEANSQSIVIISLAPFALYTFIKSNNKWLLITGVAILTFLLLSNGTKTTFYTLIILFLGFILFLLFKYFLNIRKGEKFCGSIIVVLCSMLIVTYIILPYTPYKQRRNTEIHGQNQVEQQLSNIETPSSNGPTELSSNEDYKNQFNQDLIARFGFERVLAAYGGDPSASQLLDMRLKKRIFGQLQWEESDFLTKLVGFEETRMRTPNDNFDLENDAESILYYYGYIGAGLYLILLLFIFSKVLKKVLTDFRNAMSLYNFAIILTVALQIGASIFTGYLLRRPNASIYFSLMLALCYLEATRKKPVTALTVKNIDTN